MKSKINYLEPLYTAIQNLYTLEKFEIIVTSANLGKFQKEKKQVNT